MNIVLVNPPNGSCDANDLAPPLGLLTLATAVRGGSQLVSIVDFNLEVLERPELGGDSFLDYAETRLLALDPDIVGFTSMCMESHVCLAVAERLKRGRPWLTTVFGGVHFSSIADDLTEHFDYVDYVVSGRGVATFRALIDAIAAGERPVERVLQETTLERSVASRSIEAAGGHVAFPAYDLVDVERYFARNPRRLVCYEAGRGCVFNCAFCYSPQFHGRDVWNEAPTLVVSDLRRLERLGAKHVFFVQDNLLNSAAWAESLAEEIAAAELGLTWSCYTTWPQLNHRLIDLLAASGCAGIFTGVDAVAPAAQRRMRKGFLKDWAAAADRLSYAVSKGVVPTCAFILEGPLQPIEEIEQTLRTALACRRLGCEVRINTLTLYTRTPLARAFDGKPLAYSEDKPTLLLDTPPVVCTNPLARSYPALFPYHSTPFDPAAWRLFTAKAHAAFTILYLLDGTLEMLANSEGTGIWKLMDYVDQRYCDELLTCPAPQRREFAFTRCVDGLWARTMEGAGLGILALEVARAQLASLPTARSVRWPGGQSDDAWCLRESVEMRMKPNRTRPTEQTLIAVRWDDESVLALWISDGVAETLRRVRGDARWGEEVWLNEVERQALFEGGLLYRGDQPRTNHDGGSSIFSPTAAEVWNG